MAVAVAATFSLAACDGGSQADGAQGQGGAEGSSELVAFLPPASDPYVANWLEGAEGVASDAGYSIRVITQESASAASAQVQQVLGSAEKPAAFIWWPIQPEAQVGSLAQLSASEIPVFQVNQLPVEGSDQYLTAYVGVSDLEIGKIAGDAAIQARDALVESGATLTSEGGSVIVPNLPVGYGATRDRLAGFEEAIEGSGLTITAVGNATGFAAQDAFTLVNQMISANKDDGFDIVYAPMDDFAVGGIRALIQAGYTPGEDVQVIGGSCHGDDSTLLDGTQYNTIVQGAGLEGDFAVNRIVQYLDNPTVEEGTYIAPDDADAMPELPEAISKLNIIPTPLLLADEYPTANLWGTPASTLCTY